MKYLGLNEIRERFLTFFEGKDHLRLPSFPLLPKNDNSLLLINAGMAPLKPYFTGKETPPRKRVTTCQKCIRTPDIENVGKTARHGTFFEMLGNFSFGDYFKEEVIPWAWEFCTKELELPEDRLYVSVYLDDDEAYDIWTKKVGVKEDHMVRFGKEDNFWEIGTGPCGPCSEIYFDRGAEHGCGKPDCKVGCDCDRYIEFWNLVFTQFDKDEEGVYNPLAHPNIDTGMGLERMATIMQGVNNLFEVDTIKNVIKKISQVTGVEYGADPKSDISIRVITDHVRSVTFMLCDGVAPSNEGRGYVLKRLLRRAARHGRLLGVKRPFLGEIVDAVVAESGDAYPELRTKQDFIKKIIRIEEESFNRTIDTGLGILEDAVKNLKAEGKDCLSGEDAFRLYDTYGFPLDLTLEILEEQGLKVDEEGFRAAMREQQERARSGRKEGEEAAWSEDVYQTMDKSITTEFLGYDSLETDAKVLALVKDGQVAETVYAEEEAVLIADKTVCYGESGGQVGDIGTVEGENFKAEVTDTHKLGDGKFLHSVKVTEGAVGTGDAVHIAVDKERRLAIARNHSATHLLQKALQEVLGSHVAQSGSLVNADRLRFDFSHYEAMTPDELMEVEKRVNRAILSALPIEVQIMSQEEAKKTGAMALFDEKYGDTVRVVKMGDYSIEFCGGTHLKNTCEAGLFKILSEGGVAAGVRRIEAVTGTGVLRFLEEKEAQLNEAAAVLKVSPQTLAARAASMVEELRSLGKQVEELKQKEAKGLVGDVLAGTREVNGVSVITARLDGLDKDSLRQMGDHIKDQFDCCVAVIATVNDGKITFLSLASDNAVARGAHSGKLIKEVASITGGGGGGKPERAEAGGRLVEKIDNALAIVDEWVMDNVKGE